MIRVLQAYQDGSALPEGNYTADCEKVTFPLSPDQFLELSNCLWGSDEDGRNHGPQAAPEASSPGFQELGRYIQDKVPWTYDYCCSLFVISSMSESVIHSVLTDKLPELILNHARRTVEGLPDGHPHKDQYKYKLAQLKVRNNTEARNPVDFYLAAQGEEGQDKDGDDQIQDLSGTYSLTSNTMKWWRPIPDSYLTFVSDKDISYPYPPQIFEIFWSHETLEQHLLGQSVLSFPLIPTTPIGPFANLLFPPRVYTAWQGLRNIRNIRQCQQEGFRATGTLPYPGLCIPATRNRFR